MSNTDVPSSIDRNTHCPIILHCYMCLKWYLPFSIKTYHFGDDLNASFSSFTYHMVNAITLELSSFCIGY